MSPFQAPEGPFSIESVIETIRTQVVDVSSEGSAVEPTLRTASAPTISDGGNRSRLLIQINQLAAQLYNEQPYRIRSHRKYLGWFPMMFKRALHWGTHQYVDHHRRRQQAFNETSLQLMREMLHLIDESGRGQQNAGRLAGSRGEMDFEAGEAGLAGGAQVLPVGVTAPLDLQALQGAVSLCRRELNDLAVAARRQNEEFEKTALRHMEIKASADLQTEEISMMREMQFDLMLIAQENRDQVEALAMKLKDFIALGDTVARELKSLEDFVRRFDLTETELGGLIIREQAAERRYDLAPFFDTVPFERRLAALDHSRGTFADIRERQEVYVPLLRGLPGPVLDVGCGRGEMLDLLFEAGIPAWGAEPDAPMADMAARRGLDVRKQDMHAALTSAAEGSLGGIFAAQVVEHLFPGELLAFIRLALRKLAPGGRIVLETLNPASLGVLSKSYYRDLDHKQPIHPEYLRDLLTLAGFVDVTLAYTAPFREDEKMQPLPASDEIGLNPAVREALQERLDQLDTMIHGPQDFYVTGICPAPAAQPPESTEGAVQSAAIPDAETASRS